MKKKKIIFTISFVFLILILIFVRKFLIFNSLQSKIIEYTNSNNFYIHSFLYQANKYNLEILNYRKDNKNYQIRLCTSLNNVILEKEYKENDITNRYVEFDNGKKVARLNVENVLSLEIINYFENLTLLEKAKAIFFTPLKSKQYNGKNVYEFNSIYFNKLKEYYPLAITFLVDKETGLIISIKFEEVYNDNEYNATEINNSFMDFYYMFDVVTDENVKKPNDADYEILED